MEQIIKTDEFGNMGDLLIAKPYLQAIEVDKDAEKNWLEHASPDGSEIRVFCSQSGSNGNTCFNFQIKSYGKLPTNLTSKAKPKHIVSTAYFTINELEEILDYMKKVENQ
jgi:hypothetical protein